MVGSIQGEGTAEVGLGGQSQWRVDADGGNMEEEDVADSSML